MIRELKFKLHCRHHSDDVYRFARSLLGHAADAEDATQEVLLRLWKHLDSIRRADVRPWLLKTTRNYCIDQIRRRSDQFTSLSEEELDTRPDEFAVDPALQGLSENLRSVFVLYEINGLRYREIADTLDIPINSVKVYLSRARNELKQRLTHHESWLKV